MEKKFTPEEAKAWMESRVWAKGLELEADASINAVEFAQQYAANIELWDKLFAWIKDTDLMSLEAGKYELVPGRLWINIQIYTPKSAADTRIENHDKFIDLQYTYEGDELMGVADKVVPNTEYDPVKDRTFYKAEGPVEFTESKPSRFFLYFPCDLHQPSVRPDAAYSGINRKVVGKIEYAK